MVTVSLNPTMAWKVLPHCSLAVGSDLLFAFNRMARMVNQCGLWFQNAKISFK